jgi:thymidylate synthase (FAD)
VTKYVFVKKPAVHLIADTRAAFSENLARDMHRRGADLSGHPGQGWYFQALPWLGEYETEIPTESERLCEFAGKLCYNAFGKNGSKKSTKEYLQHSVYSTSEQNPYGHLSIAYHAHFTLYVTGISRRIANEWIRHHIGTAFSQMSTRYCVHPPRFVVPPRYLKRSSRETGSLPLYHVENEYADFKKSMKSAYRHYLKQVKAAEGKKGMDKKRVLEAAAQSLPLATETSMIVTFNAISARKFCIERTGETADAEMIVVATKVRDVLEDRYKAFSFR